MLIYYNFNRHGIKYAQIIFNIRPHFKCVLQSPLAFCSLSLSLYLMCTSKNFLLFPTFKRLWSLSVHCWNVLNYSNICHDKIFISSFHSFVHDISYHFLFRVCLLSSMWKKAQVVMFFFRFKFSKRWVCFSSVPFVVKDISCHSI